MRCSCRPLGLFSPDHHHRDHHDDRGVDHHTHDDLGENGDADDENASSYQGSVMIIHESHLEVDSESGTEVGHEDALGDPAKDDQGFFSLISFVGNSC